MPALSPPVTKRPLIAVWCTHLDLTVSALEHLCGTGGWGVCQQRLSGRHEILMSPPNAWKLRDHDDVTRISTVLHLLQLLLRITNRLSVHITPFLMLIYARRRSRKVQFEVLTDL